MKKNYLYFVLLLSVFSACRKDDNRIFTESADARLNKIITSYQQQLNSSPNGWKAILTPGNEVPYSFYFRFTDSNRVVIYSDFDSTTSGNVTSSSYRLKALQQPSLIFDTYSALHKLSDPDERVNSGIRGAGLVSDFEFRFDRVVGDTIKLVGRVNGTKLSLVKATKQEADYWMNNNWQAAVRGVQNMGRIVNYFKRLTVNGVDYEINVDQANRVVIITWVDAGGITRTFVSTYTFNPALSGITFDTPFNSGTITIPGLYGIVYDGAASTIAVNIGNNVTGTIAGAIKPLSTDLTAPSRWWNRSVSADNYWVSFSGFTVNGVPDGYSVRKIPGFQFLLFWAQYGTSGGINYDLLGFVANNSLGYGPAFRPPTFTADGRIVFPYLGTLGTVPGGAVATSVTNTRTMMADPAGFYFVQTGQDVFDMVSAKDAKSWITWEW